MEAQKGLNKYYETVLSCDDAIQALLQGSSLNHCVLDDFEEYEKIVEHNTLDVHLPTQGVEVDDYFNQKVSNWLIPNKYKSINIKEYVYGLCETDEQRNRVELEYALYEKFNLIDVLRLFVYLVDVFRTNNIVWGVGRGSSVASYILYLIGVHKIDSLAYNLDITEFLKE